MPAFVIHRAHGTLLPTQTYKDARAIRLQRPFKSSRN